ncbi:MAG TPA: hypothetical protein VK775_13855 [Chthoniobacterales bacterium]|jgi:hypothetical protein|nr:hypothetical protein [Chthoniobacterales bacterium]
MRTLLLLELGSRKDRANFRSDGPAKASESSLAGTILAGRYKVLETIDVDSYKGHDLALDQTVFVRKTLPASPGENDIWRQKVRQLALAQNANFLNVIDLVSEKSSDFVITESPRGRSIADLLKERSRFDPEDILDLIAPLAGALDLAASLACCANSISARWLFAETRRSFALNSEERSLSGLPPFFVKMDVWELVRPRKNVEWPFPISKAKSGSSRELAVRQAALLSYELLGGDKKTGEGKLKRWFKQVNGLGDAGNALLYRGLKGSSLFESSGSFFQRLRLAISSAKGRGRTLDASMSQSREHPVVSARFDRDTTWLVTGVLGVLVFATLLAAICLFISASVLASF